MNRDTLKEAIEAEGNERIECPVCGDEILAFELATDHAHTQELLELVVDLLPEETDDDYDEGGDGLRETIIRFDPEGVAPPSMPERLRAHEDGASIDEIDTLPERRVFAVGNEADYERIAEATWGVANAFVGSSLHAGHELVACPECGYEGSVDQAVFPGGTDHHPDGEKETEEE